MSLLFRFSLVLLLLISSGSRLSSQSLQPVVIASDGEFYTSTSGSISWTLGEPMSETYSITGNFLTQGFQQPSIMLVTSDVKDLLPFIVLYPNPATTEISIQTNLLSSGNYNIEILDRIGRTLYSSLFAANSGTGPYKVSVADFPNGMYFVRLFSGTSDRSIKFIKAN